MSEPSTARSLVEDLDTILSDPEPPQVRVEVTPISALTERKARAAAALHSPDTQAGGKAASLHEPDRKPGGGGGPAKPKKSLERKAREKRKAKSAGKGGGGHNPFKTKSKLGPGPRKGTLTQRKKWSCTCRTPYKCACRAGKRTKTITISRDYKKAYNVGYKRWRKGQRS